MPIVRTYGCSECNHMMEVVLSSDQWDCEPPECPACAQRQMRQEFKPPAIVGSNRARAVAIAEDIAANDYNVADIKGATREGDVAKVRYKDQGNTLPSAWSTQAAQMLESAIAVGRQTRLKHGNGLDVLQSALKSGAQPDLIEQSKKRAIKIW
jgi:hypothetical protein